MKYRVLVEMFWEVEADSEDEACEKVKLCFAGDNSIELHQPIDEKPRVFFADPVDAN